MPIHVSQVLDVHAGLKYNILLSIAENRAPLESTTMVIHRALCTHHFANRRDAPSPVDRQETGTTISAIKTFRIFETSDVAAVSRIVFRVGERRAHIAKHACSGYYFRRMIEVFC